MEKTNHETSVVKIPGKKPRKLGKNRQILGEIRKIKKIYILRSFSLVTLIFILLLLYIKNCVKNTEKTDHKSEIAIPILHV